MILQRILNKKIDELVLTKKSFNLNEIKLLIDKQNDFRSLKNQCLFKNPVILAEFKRSSPSSGKITEANLFDVIKMYESMNVDALSILTESNYFGGSITDIVDARKYSNLPILRKDFIIDEYQIYETKACGADIILLIAACLAPDVLKKFAKLAKQIGLEVLLEVHSELEYKNYISDDIDFVGVNNRNLNSLTCSIDVSLYLKHLTQNSFIFLSESGISSQSEINQLSNAGYRGFLIGESLLKNKLKLN